MFDLFEILPFAFFPSPASIIILPLLIYGSILMLRAHKSHDPKLWKKTLNASLIAEGISILLLIWALAVDHGAAFAAALLGTIAFGIFILIYIYQKL